MQTQTNMYTHSKNMKAWELTFSSFLFSLSLYLSLSRGLSEEPSLCFSLSLSLCFLSEKSLCSLHSPRGVWREGRKRERKKKKWIPAQINKWWLFYPATTWKHHNAKETICLRNQNAIIKTQDMHACMHAHTHTQLSKSGLSYWDGRVCTSVQWLCAWVAWLCSYQPQAHIHRDLRGRGVEFTKTGKKQLKNTRVTQRPFLGKG